MKKSAGNTHELRSGSAVMELLSLENSFWTQQVINPNESAGPTCRSQDYYIRLSFIEQVPKIIKTSYRSSWLVLRPFELPKILTSYCAERIRWAGAFVTKVIFGHRDQKLVKKFCRIFLFENLNFGQIRPFFS